jgi:GT2 family glycosyltransferase
MSMENNLSWALVVATYGREKVLPMSIRLAVRQTRPPQEIVIVDSSDNWEEIREHILSTVAVEHPEIRWIYVAAERRSTTLQRNQGILLATADVLFLFDDDSMMYPDCAEKIMAVYEADSERAIMGVQSNFADQLPSDSIFVDDSRQKKGISQAPVATSFFRLLWKNRFLQHLLILDTKNHFIPYDGRFMDYPVPDAIKRFNAVSVRIFDGYRMTFRREAFDHEIFEPLFLFYAAAEDADFSYRVSRHGALVTVTDARLHHFQSGSGRLSAARVSALTGLNMAFCLRRHSNNLRRDRSRYYRFILHLLVIEGIKDLVNRRWTIPRTRGLLLALRYMPKLFAANDQTLAEWYPSLQQKLIQL